MKAAIVCALLAGCVSSSSTQCPGLICPEGKECATVGVGSDMAPTGFCVLPSQIAACQDTLDGTACDAAGDPGTCHDHVCLADRCGNALVDSAEACDDGNTAADDGCSAICDSNETCGNSVTDLVRHETCDDGGGRSHDGCASECRVERPAWRLLEDAHPGERRRPAFAYDVARRRAVVFGGAYTAGERNDTLEWDGHAWTRIDSQIVPATSQELMAYDDDRKTLVLLSGGETWERDFAGQWELRPTMTRPESTGYQAVYDARNHRVVVVGVETWAWDGMTWRSFPSPTALARFSDFGLAYDAKRGVVVLFGGTERQVVSSGIFELDGDTWTQPMPMTGPTGRFGAAMAYDPITERVMVVGGQFRSGISLIATDEVWSWNGVAWAKHTPVFPEAGSSGLANHGILTDTTRGRVVVIDARGALQEWNGQTWDRIGEPQQTPIVPRWIHTAALDPIHRELVVFGGLSGGGSGDDQTWIYNGAWRSPTFSKQPPARHSAAMAFDSTSGDIVLFGGRDVNGGFLDDTWRFHDRQWIPAQPARSPPARENHTMAFDPVRQQVVVIGGAGTTQLDDIWAWTGSTWEDVTPDVRPPGSVEATLATDPVRGQLVLFGGVRAGEYTDDTWVWDGTWRQVTGLRPTARTSAMAWDAARQRIVMFGGTSFMGYDADTWAWDGSTWELVGVGLPRPAARAQHIMAPALDGDGVLLVGGYAFTSTFAFDDTWQLRWESDQRSEACSDVDQDDDGLAGCLDPDCDARCKPTATSTCGDRTCNTAIESCYLCELDCGPCP